MFFWSRQTIENFAKKHTTPINYLKKISKIILIDNEENALPLKELQNDGFTIEQQTAVSPELLQRLIIGDFDIIILDIKDIADKHLIKNDGQGVLKYIKEHNPSQIVIAFSSKKFDMNTQKFFKLADDTMSKPIVFTECKEVLEQIISEKLNITARWNEFSKMLTLHHFSNKQIKKIEKGLFKKDHSNWKRLLAHLETNSDLYSLFCTLGTNLAQLLIPR
ncbi:hypothetical protein [Candidatus Avelusimicrobium facis]|uniref:hypothetical protein n=1 Tax=Candidatus Avelusimicrobium facis TaxID=3416203 RepID=UPI003D0D2CEC